MDGRGYFTAGRWRGIPIRIHWTAPLGALLWTGGSPSLTRIGAFLFVILVHELGHAVLVRWARARVTEITIHAMGGECWWQGEATPIQHAVIAFGGVWAQALLAAGTYLFTLGSPPESTMALNLVDMFTRYSLYNAAFNLVPVPPLDGSKAWKLFPLLLARARSRRRKRKSPQELREFEREMKKVLERAAKKTVGKP
jgi:membrane-associated protease RseP (regulator of RpoE activity)